MSATAELTHPFRWMKAPVAACAMPKLCERARSEEWSSERFTEALMATEIASRDASGGEPRIKPARFPAPTTLEEIDFTFQRLIKKQTAIKHLRQLDFLHARENGHPPRTTPAPARHISRSPSRPAHASPGEECCSAPPPSGSRCSPTLNAKATSMTNCVASSATRSRSATRSATFPFDPQPANLMFMLVSRRYERASLIVISSKPFSAWGEILGDDAAAMIDRLVHHAAILSLKGDSYRLKNHNLGTSPATQPTN
jgi:hypothetical protein